MVSSSQDASSAWSSRVSSASISLVSST
jgi:hypothetical protein